MPPEEVARLIKEGARKDEAILADKWQQYFGVKLVGYELGVHKSIIQGKPADNEMLTSNHLQKLSIQQGIILT